MKDDQINLAKQFIKDADAVLITAGAGMGVDSGLPDFRGNEGLWSAYPPIKRLGLDFKQMESSSLFRTNPQLAWGFYGHRINLYRENQPNKSFEILKKLVKNKEYFIFTSNVDTHFQKANFPEEKIYEIHGSIEYLQCIDNCNKQIIKNTLGYIDVDMATLTAEDIPLCEECSQPLMPNILMFGNGIFNDTNVLKQNERFKKWLHDTKDMNLVIFEIGVGTTIPTIRNFNDSYARRNKNCKLVRINPRDFYVDSQIGYSVVYGGLNGLTKLLSE